MYVEWRRTILFIKIFFSSVPTSSPILLFVDISPVYSEPFHPRFFLRSSQPCGTKAFTLPLRLFHVRMFLPRLILCSRCPWMIDFGALFFPVTLSPCTLAPCMYSVHCTDIHPCSLILCTAFSCLYTPCTILPCTYDSCYIVTAFFSKPPRRSRLITKYLLMYIVQYRAVSGVFQNKDPPPPLHPASVSSPPPPPKAGGTLLHSRRAVSGWGVNILEDARHWIGLV
jgi:hypothetical protein